MATPGELVEAMAEALGIPAATVTQYDRTLSENGLRSKGGRGTSAAKVTPLDAARLLIAILATQSPSRAAESVVDFGNLVLADNHINQSGYPLSFETLGLSDVRNSHTFEQAVTAIISSFAQEGFIEAFLKSAAARPRGRGGYSPPVIAIDVLDTSLKARIQIEASAHVYDFQPLVTCKDSDLHGSVAKAYFSIARKYRRSIKSSRGVELDAIKTIAAAVNGCDPLPSSIDLIKGRLDVVRENSRTEA